MESYVHPEYGPALLGTDGSSCEPHDWKHWTTRLPSNPKFGFCRIPQNGPLVGTMASVYPKESSSPHPAAPKYRHIKATGLVCSCKVGAGSITHMEVLKVRGSVVVYGAFACDPAP